MTPSDYDEHDERDEHDKHGDQPNDDKLPNGNAQTL
jgi:hypothetical protein